LRIKEVTASFNLSQDIGYAWIKPGATVVMTVDEGDDPQEAYERALELAMIEVNKAMSRLTS
jgi:hypothetical protein